MIRIFRRSQKPIPHVWRGRGHSIRSVWHWARGPVCANMFLVVLFTIALLAILLLAILLPIAVLLVLTAP